MSAEDSAELRLSAMVCLGVFASALDMAVVNVALPSIARSLGVGGGDVGWVASSYSFAVAATVVFFGHFADRAGRLAVFRGGLVVFAASSVACGVATKVSWLIAARCLQGAGAAMLQATASALVTDLSRPARHGPLVSNVGMAIALGMLMGPSVGGLLVEAVGWRWIFLGNLPVCLGAFGLGATLTDITQAARGTGGFGHCIALLRGPTAAAFVANLTAAVAFGGCTGVTLLLPPMLLESHGRLATWQVGLVACGVPAGVFASTKLSGVMVRSMPPERLMEWGAAGMVVAVGAMGCAQPAWGPEHYFPALLLYGVGGGLFQTPNILYLLQGAPPDLRGLVGALQRMAQALGVALGAAWATWAWGRFFGERGAAAVSRAGWWAAGLALLGAWALLRWATGEKRTAA